MPCNDPNQPCGCSVPLQRREFLKLSGLTALTVLAAAPADGQSGDPDESTIGLVPIDKHLDPAWLASLTVRGERAVYRGKDLAKIGMPVGGICAGQLYLGGDGKLWHWDIFNQHIGTGDEHYAHPPDPDHPIEQGFALRITSGAGSQIRTLDKSGFSDITFTGEYPIGYVNYADPDCPVTVSLEAFSPFIPLNTHDSSLPATVMSYTVRNHTAQKVEVELVGWIQNAVCLHTGSQLAGIRRSEVRSLGGGGDVLVCRAEEIKPAQAPREPIVFADFEGEDWGDWKVEGTAFGTGPAHGGVGDQRLSGFKGNGFANSFAHFDPPQGKLTSPTFKIERPYISFIIGGGNHPGKTCINLVVDEKVVRTSTGRNSDQMFWDNWHVDDLAGKDARIEIVDAESGGWGHIEIDQIQFGDVPVASRPMNRQPDYGTMALAILGPHDDFLFSPTLPAGEAARAMFEDGVLKEMNRVKAVSTTGTTAPMYRGAIGQKMTIEAGREETVSFLLTWCFPNFSHPADANMTAGNYYAKNFADAEAVAQYVADNFDRLARETRLWHDTWYDSTLPYWALDRTFLNTSILATATCRRWRNGRFWCWEGVGCCIGTCTHVWHYAQAVARLFPELERSTREIQDLDTGFDPISGSIGMRGEFERLSATDGQTGTILRIYREHQMSADDDFLNRNWPRIKKAVEFLLRQDPKDEGTIDGRQPNTLDTSYFGPNAMISSLYVASLHAAARMASEVADLEFAAHLTEIAEHGTKRICDTLWNGEYFIQIPDPNHPDAMKTGQGSFIDQVFGQSWAWQVGLGRVLPRDKTLSALAALWKYNFATDVGPYRAKYKPGRWYAMPGEAGLLMCTWPHGGYAQSRGKVNPGFAAYLNECMNGFEYQAAGHMIWEGMLTEGLAITRALHDRYAASKRNPWNEVECGDHYARSMASYGVFLALCGYEHHGPGGYLAFAPRITPDDFRAAFTTAQGWGTFQQKRTNTRQTDVIEVKWGRLRLARLRFEVPQGLNVTRVGVTVAGNAVTCEHGISGQSVEIRFAEDMSVKAGETVEVTIGGNTLK